MAASRTRRLLAGLLVVVAVGGVLVPALTDTATTYRQEPANGSYAYTVEWTETYTGPTPVHVVTAIETETGFAIGGQVPDDESPGPHAWMLNVSADGTEVWNRSYEGEDSGGPEEMVQTADGGYLFVGSVTGYASRYSDNGKDAWVLRLASNGTALWNSTYDRGDREVRFQDVVQTPDGEYLVAGWRDPQDEETYYRPFLVRIADDGSEVWRRTYDVEQWPDGAKFTQIQQTDDGYVVAGNGHRGALLASVADDGEIQWTESYEDDDITVNGLEQHSDGYLLAGSSVPYGTYQNESAESWSDAWLLRTDETGTVVWNRTYGDEERNEQATDVVRTADGDTIVAVRETDDSSAAATRNGSWQWSLVRVDDDGEQTDSEQVPHVETVESLVQTADGGLLVAGNTGENASLLKLTRTQSATPTPTATATPTPTVSPTPGNESVGTTTTTAPDGGTAGTTTTETTDSTDDTPTITDEMPTPTQSPAPPPEETETVLPGFGLLATLLALVGVLLLARL